MVLFLDKKEQVLEFELTPYGKHLFSVGKLDPKYYSFYDDDILYDSNYQTGTVDGAATAPLVLESQNSIVTRISDTQRIGSVTNFTEFLTNNSIGEVSVGLLADEFDQQMLENSNGIGPLKTDGNNQTRGKPIYMQKRFSLHFSSSFLSPNDYIWVRLKSTYFQYITSYYIYNSQINGDHKCKAINQTQEIYTLVSIIVRDC